MNKILEQWENSTQILATYFAKRYFGKDATDVYWVGDIVGGVLAVNDYFFSLSDMIEFIRHDYGVERMFDYYDYALEFATRNMGKELSPICIRDYKKLKIKNPNDK